MKTTSQLVRDLRNEHNNLCDKIAAGEFALRTLPLDEKEKELLDGQIMNMKWYAEKLRDRAAYAIKKDQPEAEK